MCRLEQYTAADCCKECLGNGDMWVSLGDLFPRPHGEHGGEKRIGVSSIHSRCMLLDTLSISKDKGPPETCAHDCNIKVQDACHTEVPVDKGMLAAVKTTDVYPPPMYMGLCHPL